MNPFKKAKLIFLFIFMVTSPQVYGAENVAERIKTPLSQSIHIRQKNQKERDQWEKERVKLQRQFEQLQDQNKELKARKKMLEKKEESLGIQNQHLFRQKQSSMQIAKEMLPFLRSTHQKIKQQITFGAPFLLEERKKRLQYLEGLLEDDQVSVAEKFRKTMETLFIEAEYGNTVEVYQKKVMLGQDERIGNVFRLGRMSLFFLTLDLSEAAIYSVFNKKWMRLEKKYVGVINAAMEMGLKRRRVEVVPLPIGRLAGK